MSPRRVLIPTFKLSQVCKREDGSITPHLEIITSNMAVNVESMESQGSPANDNVMYICIKEKMEDGDYLCGIAAVPFNKNDNDLIEILLHKFEKMPHVVVSLRPGIGDIVKRVLKNLIFS